jgi:hypothetical protein
MRRGLRSVRRCGTLCGLRLASFLELHFLFELLAELSGHGARPANPAANF